MLEIIITVKGYTELAREYQLEASAAYWRARKDPTKENLDDELIARANSMRCFHKAANLLGDTDVSELQIPMLLELLDSTPIPDIPFE